MIFVVKNSNQYYDTVLDIYQQVMEYDEREIHLSIEIKKDAINLSLLQDFLDVIDTLQKEYRFALTTDIQTDIPELKQLISV